MNQKKRSYKIKGGKKQKQGSCSDGSSPPCKNINSNQVGQQQQNNNYNNGNNDRSNNVNNIEEKLLGKIKTRSSTGKNSSEKKSSAKKSPKGQQISSNYGNVIIRGPAPNSPNRPEGIPMSSVPLGNVSRFYKNTPTISTVNIKVKTAPNTQKQKPTGPSIVMPETRQQKRKSKALERSAQETATEASKSMAEYKVEQANIERKDAEEKAKKAKEAAIQARKEAAEKAELSRIANTIYQEKKNSEDLERLKKEKEELLKSSKVLQIEANRIIKTRPKESQKKIKQSQKNKNDANKLNNKIKNLQKKLKISNTVKPNNKPKSQRETKRNEAVSGLFGNLGNFGKNASNKKTKKMIVEENFM